jgi:coproporphyrinogen III oxidase-like Fe-S oxidoreductase
MLPANFDEFFNHASAEVNVEAIREQWLAVTTPYDINQWLLPLPLWAKRGYDNNGTQAWEILRRDLSRVSIKRPMCIYMHIPFCTNKCGFCDSYSFKLGAHQNEHHKQYSQRLIEEMRLWRDEANLGNPPISTVHLGGGTPTSMGERHLEKIIGSIRDNFNTSQNTEFALESNVKTLTPSMIACLHRLGFRRLHIGVQSMEDSVRKAIGRQCLASEVLSVIAKTIELGWVVSVDLICGLPGQTLRGWIDGINQLAKFGTNGFSLYELLIYPQNYRWALGYGLINRSHLPNYFLFQTGVNLLDQLGFHKNLFNHWADENDNNIYFTFPVRNEDLLALGAIADGVFGNYHYRHHRYAGYNRYAQGGFPGLQGGLRRRPLEDIAHQPITAILSGTLSLEMLDLIRKTAHTNGEDLVLGWQKRRLIEPGEHGGVRLTANGSWFAGNMIAELVSHIS